MIRAHGNDQIRRAQNLCRHSSLVVLRGIYPPLQQIGEDVRIHLLRPRLRAHGAHSDDDCERASL